MNNKEKVEKVLAQYLVLQERAKKAEEKWDRAASLVEKKRTQVKKIIDKEFPDLKGDVLPVGGKAISLKNRFGYKELVIENLI